MTEYEPLDWIWFTTSKGTVGIVKMKSEYGVVYRISSVDGFMEKMDVLQVCAWGAEFPKLAGEKLFGDKE